MKSLLPLVSAGFVSLLLVGCQPPPANEPESETKGPSIAVNGGGEVWAVPDQAELSVGLLARAATSDAASSQVNADAAALIQALKDAGVEAASIQTGYVNVQPEYEPRQAVVVHSLADKPKPRAIVGYNARYQLQIKIKPLEKVKAISEAIRQAKGFSSLNGPSLSVAEPETHAAQAQEKAYASALRQAEALAAQAGLEIVGPQSIAVGGGQNPMPMMMARSGAMDAENASMPLEAGQQRVTAQVQVIFNCRPTRKK